MTCFGRASGSLKGQHPLPGRRTAVYCNIPQGAALTAPLTVLLRKITYWDHFDDRLSRVYSWISGAALPKALMDRMLQRAHVGTAVDSVATARATRPLWWRIAATSQEPFHMTFSDDIFEDLMQIMLVCYYELRKHPRKEDTDVKLYYAVASSLSCGGIPSKEMLLGAFKRKSHELAGRKANVFADKLLADIKEDAPRNLRHVGRILCEGRAYGLSDDQLCSCLLYAAAVSRHINFDNAFRVAIVSVREPTCAKALSDILKAMGGNMHWLGRQLCELQTLQGRGVAPVNLDDDAARRLEGSFSCPVVNVSADELREVVRDILTTELNRTPVLADIDTFWSQRYRWCVGGSHNIGTNAHWLQRDKLPNVGDGVRWNRRAALQCVSDNPLRRWNGDVHVSVAEKKEHGKGRAIYSCDTLSYVAFSWVLDEVERAWASKNVILDPGRDGSVGLVNRIRGISRTLDRPTYVMCDYSDFNVQHTLQSMRIVFEETLAKCINVDSNMATLLTQSFHRTYVHLHGRVLGRIAGTLMSGHRATTYLNSVLNAAYCRLAFGRQRYSDLRPLHVGDDVLMFAQSNSQGWEAIHDLERLGCTLQRSKQSVGSLGYEFLRMAGDPESGVGGYVARSIAGLVSGNWVTAWKLEPREALQSYIHQTRSIMNRSYNPEAWRYLAGSAAAITRVPHDILSELLSGQVALAPGPCYRSDKRYVARHILWASDQGAEDALKGERDMLLGRPLTQLPQYASKDYITKGLSRVERSALYMVGRVPYYAMASSCYRAMEPSGQNGDATGLPYRYIGPRTVRLKQGSVLSSHVSTTAARHGVLVQYPLLSLMKNSLDEQQVRELLYSVGVEPGENPMVTAWGGENEGVVVDGMIPYSDAAGCGSRNLAKAVEVDVPVAM